MLQSLLEDRFHLKLHHETKDAPIYALVVANPSHPGPGLTPAREDDCVRIDPAKPLSAESTPICGGVRTTPKVREGQAGSAAVLFQAYSVSLGSLPRLLAGPLQRQVVDETHLRGNFDVNLEYAAGGSDALADPPSIFTAIQEHLGLKLEPRKGSVEVYVIDHVERPTEN